MKVVSALLGLSGWLALLVLLPAAEAQTFSVASYNVENYLDRPAGNRREKTAAARAQIRQSIRAAQADVLALQEMGGTNALLELRASLRTEGLDYPYWDHTAGFDTNIHVAVLSRFPLRSLREPERENYLLRGRRFHVSRGFAQLEIRVTPRYSFTLLVAHLKSKVPVPEADQRDMREQEALLLREIIDARLRANPNANLAVVGDLNDSCDSRPVRILVGHGRHALTDVRPAETVGAARSVPEPSRARDGVAWTYHYAKQDSYERFDYILLSPGMTREWTETGTRVVTLPDWGTGSDHRPIMAAFVAEDR